MAAVLAVFALLVQALLPAAAMAAQAREPAGAAIVICTQAGVQTIQASDHGKAGETGKGGFAGLPCHDCLAAAVAALPAPEIAEAPVAYETARVEHAPTHETSLRGARARPRPPGQGPPLLNV